ncbi:MAG: PaaI family thioesterase [Fervidicoccaceae archaeon]
MYTDIRNMLEDLIKEGKSLEEALDISLRRFNPIYSLLELKLAEIGNGRAVGTFPFLKQFVNPNGTIHGGIIAAAVDQIGSVASWTSHRGENQVTLELKINYLRPLTEDESPFKVIGEVLKSGKTTIVTEVRIYGKSGSLLVAALGTWFK